MRFLPAVTLSTGLIVASCWAASAPLPGKVLSVYDGDTFTAEIEHWPNQFYRGPVRVRGIDAPEIKGACAAEKELAVKAREMVKALTAKGILVDDIALDKYGRLLATVTVGGEDLATKMLAAGLARSYAGDTRQPWC